MTYEQEPEMEARMGILPRRRWEAQVQWTVPPVCSWLQAELPSFRSQLPSYFSKHPMWIITIRERVDFQWFETPIFDTKLDACMFSHPAFLALGCADICRFQPRNWSPNIMRRASIDAHCECRLRLYFVDIFKLQVSAKIHLVSLRLASLSASL